MTLAPNLDSAVGCSRAVEVLTEADDTLGVAYARLLRGALTGRGVRLSADEVSALAGDHERMQRIVRESLSYLEAA